jgi:peptidase E
MSLSAGAGERGRLPLVLLADSQLLFCPDQTGRRFLDRLRALVAAEEPRAAYLGAANGDRPEFYEIFTAAMQGVGIAACRHVPAEPTDADRIFLEEADLILLAGGHVGRGYAAMNRAGITDTLVRRAFGGALVIGLSAGAVHLGLCGYADDADTSAEPLDLLRVVPFAVDAHAEPEWARLRRLVGKKGPYTRGLGVPYGGGVLIHPDGAVEAVRREALLLVWKDEQVQDVLAVPPATDGAVLA